MTVEDKSEEYRDLQKNKSNKYYYQIQLVKDIENKLLNSDKVAGMLVLPTGGGKTRIAVTAAIDSAINNGYKVLWIAHRLMLLEQAEKTFYEFSKLAKNELSINVISGGHNRIESIDKNDNVIIISNQSMGIKEKSDRLIKGTLKKKVFTKEQKWLIIVDEAHHSLAQSYKEWIGLEGKSKTAGWLRKHRKDNIKILGLTATPNFIVENNRLPYDENKTRALSAIYDNNMIGSISTQRLIDSGVLSRPNFITIDTDIDFDAGELLSQVEKVKESLEDYVLEQILNKKIAEHEGRNQLIVKTYLNGDKNIDFTQGQTLVFASNIINAMALKVAFKHHDIAVDLVHSEQSKSHNDEIINDFRTKKIKVLINVQILTEGSDIPEIQNVFISRITRSKVLFKQMVGRALRGVDSGGTETANIVTFKDNIINHQQDLFNTQQFEDGLFNDIDEVQSSNSQNENIEFTEDDLDKVWQKFIGLGGDIKIPLTSAIRVGYYDLDEARINVYEHQLQSYKIFLDEYSRDNLIINNEYTKLQELYFNSDNMLFNIEESDIISLFDYIKEAEVIPRFIEFAFKSKLEKELNEIASEIVSKDLGLSALAKEFENTKYAKDFYPVKQFIKECQDLARELSYGAVPLKVIEIKKSEQSQYTFNEHIHNKEKIFKDASDKICKYLGKDKLELSPDGFEWTKEAYKSYWGMAHYFADGFSKIEGDNRKIKINKILQLKEIDSRVIEFVVYHELLHTELHNYSHNEEFKKYEAMFPDFEEWKHILYKINEGEIK